jgi:hypothetical protein
VLVSIETFSSNSAGVKCAQLHQARPPFTHKGERPLARACSLAHFVPFFFPLLLGTPDPARWNNPRLTVGKDSVKGYGQWNTWNRTTFNQQYPPCSLWSQQAPCTKAMATTTECKSNELLFSTATTVSINQLFTMLVHRRHALHQSTQKQLKRLTAPCIHLFMCN